MLPTANPLPADSCRPPSSQICPGGTGPAEGNLFICLLHGAAVAAANLQDAAAQGPPGPRGVKSQTLSRAPRLRFGHSPRRHGGSFPLRLPFLASGGRSGFPPVYLFDSVAHLHGCKVEHKTRENLSSIPAPGITVVTRVLVYASLVSDGKHTCAYV